ncbi:LysR family transcriptional regulator [Amycolatopsis azurea]|uniref:LysR family transcriptional regulator n=2 Tax=Amycolatopsis azurea DSM 43854 TaxID=1238180 RepID=A0ABX3JJV4_9PSEU|nr:LysR family transcriptional regulator [Amycolatopsis azurea]OOC08019.1 LysR family transcriptional regulator [Amycolatopsis azurea DSM 43854]
MTAPELDILRLLVLVGELGSISQAAAVLGMTQPSASKRLSTVERRLGLVLIDRTRRGSALTPDGRVIVGRAHRVLGELAGLLDGAEALRTRHEAGLRIAASMTLAEHLVPGWIGELNRANPGLRLGLEVTNSDQVAELARSGKVDLGFVESPGALPGLTSWKVAVDRLVVVVSGGHPWARDRRPLTAAELASTPLVVREPGSGTRETVDTALRKAGLGPVKPLLELGSASAVRNAVVAGAGPAVISALDVTDHGLVPVEVEGVDFGRTMRAVWPEGRRLAGPAAELLALAVRRSSRG